MRFRTWFRFLGRQQDQDRGWPTSTVLWRLRQSMVQQPVSVLMRQVKSLPIGLKVNIWPRTHFQTRTMTVPCTKTLRMLGCNTSCCTIWSPENYGDINNTCRHVEPDVMQNINKCSVSSKMLNMLRFCCRVDDMVNRLHGEVKCHEFTYWSQACLLWDR